jgi:hypothetical protein
MIKTMLKIGLDFHGVLEECKDDEYVKSLLKILNTYHIVYVVSGPPSEQLMKELTEAGYEIGIHYQAAISVVDWIKSNKIYMYQKDGNWWTTDGKWFSSKADICKHYCIDFMIDDMIKYRNAFEDKSKFVHYTDRKDFINFVKKLIKIYESV